MKLKLLIIGFIFMFLNANAQNIPLYVGTYTGSPYITTGNSEGIYKLQFNTETGVLSKKTLAIHIDNPSFLWYSPNRKYLYSTNGTGGGFLSSYKINDDGTLSLLTRVHSHGVVPCHISLNKLGTKAVASNYHGGNISIHPIKEDGSLGEASQVFNPLFRV